MAYIVNSGRVIVANTTSASIPIPTHTTGDLLLYLSTKSSVGTHTTSSTGWNAGTPVANSTTISFNYFWKVATSSSETLTVTTGTTGVFNGAVYVIKDAGPTTPIEAQLISASSSSATNTVTGVTTLSENALVITGLSKVGSTTGYVTPFGYQQLENVRNNTMQSHVFTIKKDAGASGNIVFGSAAATIGIDYSFSIKNATNGKTKPHIDLTSSVGYLLHPMNSVVSTSGGQVTATASSYPGGQIGITNDTTLQASTTLGIQEYGGSILSSGNGDSGFVLTLDTPADFTNKYLLSANKTSTNYSIINTIEEEGGLLVSFYDSNNNYKTFSVNARQTYPRITDWVQFAISPSSTVGVRASSGTLNISDIKRISCIKMLTSTGSASVNWHAFYVIDKMSLVGGSQNLPLDNDALLALGESFSNNTITRYGSSAFLLFAPLQIGGNLPVYCDLNNVVLQFPRRYSAVNREVNYNVETNKVGLNILGKSGDVIKLTNTMITSPSEYFFSIDSSSTNGATYDFVGTSLIGAKVTLKPVTTFKYMIFSKCTQIDVSGCNISNCEINSVSPSNGSFIVNGSSNITKTTFKLNTLTSGNYFCSTGDPNIFTNCSFVGGGGHAIRLTTPGTYTLTGCDFSSFGADGTDGAAILNDSGGTITLNISGGTTPTVKNGAGASTTVNNALPIVLENLVVGSSYYIFKNSDNSVIASGTASTSTVNASSPSAGLVTVRVRKAGYIPFETGGNVTSSGLGVYVNQTEDTVYEEA